MEFNNNNYLPAFPGAGGTTTGSAMSAPVYAQVPTSPHYGGPVPHSGFTFTSPTQCNTSSTPRPSIQAFSPMCNMSAPGVGANWQHSVPTTRQRITRSSPPPQSRAGTSSRFTGFHSQKGFFLSQSSSIKKAKRKASDEPDGVPSCKVHLCLDKLRKLQISPEKHKGHEKYGYQGENTSRNSCWQHFHEIENRLEEELDLEVTEMSLEPNSAKEKGPLIQVADGVIQINKNEPILPRRVIQDVQKPCMQLVLWQSPAATIRDVLIGKDLSAPQSVPSTPPVSPSAHLKDNGTSSPCTQPPSTALSSMETMEVNSDFDQSSYIFRQNPESMFSVPSIHPLLNTRPAQSQSRLSTSLSTRTSNRCVITSAGSLGHSSLDRSSFSDVDMQS